MISDRIFKKPIATLILAAGESRRMNYPKSMLQVSNGTRFIDIIIQEFVNFNCSEIVVVINKELKENIFLDDRIIIIINEHLEYERFYSIKIGLQALYNHSQLSKEVNSDFCFIYNIDNPFIKENILSTLYKNRIGEGYVFPTFKGHGGHPVLIGKKIIEAVISEEKNDLNFRDFLNNYKYKKIEINDDSVLININSMDDYKHYFKNI